jgi:hypothetical protein
VLIAAVILVPLAGQLFGFLGRLVSPPQAPICYSSRQLKAPVPLREMPMEQEAEELTLGGHIPELREKAIEAQRACPPNNCAPAEQKAYTGAVNSYLAYRMDMMAKMERNYGEPGLDFARQVFSSSTDKNIENGFILRHASGDYRYNPQLIAMREAVAILTDPTRGRRYFEPCPTLRPEPRRAARSAGRMAHALIASSYARCMVAAHVPHAQSRQNHRHAREAARPHRRTLTERLQACGLVSVRKRLDVYVLTESRQDESTRG